MDSEDWSDSDSESENVTPVQWTIQEEDEAQIESFMRSITMSCLSQIWEPGPAQLVNHIYHPYRWAHLPKPDGAPAPPFNWVSFPCFDNDSFDQTITPPSFFSCLEDTLKRQPDSLVRPLLQKMREAFAQELPRVSFLPYVLIPTVTDSRRPQCPSVNLNLVHHLSSDTPRTLALLRRVLDDLDENSTQSRCNHPDQHGVVLEVFSKPCFRDFHQRTLDAMQTADLEGLLDSLRELQTHYAHLTFAPQGGLLLHIFRTTTESSVGTTTPFSFHLERSCHLITHEYLDLLLQQFREAERCPCHLFWNPKWIRHLFRHLSTDDELYGVDQNEVQDAALLTKKKKWDIPQCLIHGTKEFVSFDDCRERLNESRLVFCSSDTPDQLVTRVREVLKLSAPQVSWDLLQKWKRQLVSLCQQRGWSGHADEKMTMVLLQQPDLKKHSTSSSPFVLYTLPEEELRPICQRIRCFWEPLSQKLRSFSPALATKPEAFAAHPLPNLQGQWTLDRASWWHGDFSPHRNCPYPRVTPPHHGKKGKGKFYYSQRSLDWLRQMIAELQMELSSDRHPLLMVNPLDQMPNTDSAVLNEKFVQIEKQVMSPDLHGEGPFTLTCYCQRLPKILEQVCHHESQSP